MNLTYEQAYNKLESILEKLELKKDGYFLVSAHREENIIRLSYIMVTSKMLVK